MNPTSLQAIGLMTGIITSDKPSVTEDMKQQAKKILNMLLTMVERDVTEHYQLSSNILS